MYTWKRNEQNSITDLVFTDSPLLKDLLDTWPDSLQGHKPILWAIQEEATLRANIYFEDIGRMKREKLQDEDYSLPFSSPESELNCVTDVTRASRHSISAYHIFILYSKIQLVVRSRSTVKPHSQVVCTSDFPASDTMGPRKPSRVRLRDNRLIRILFPQFNSNLPSSQWQSKKSWIYWSKCR